MQSAIDTIRALSEVDRAPTSVRAGVLKTSTDKNFQRKSAQRPAGTQVVRMHRNLCFSPVVKLFCLRIMK